MLKKIILLSVVSFCFGLSFSGTVEETELLSAQVNYQKTIKKFKEVAIEVNTIENNLNQAKSRLQAAQRDVERLEAEFAKLQNENTNAQSALEQAGERLEKAWQSVDKK